MQTLCQNILLSPSPPKKLGKQGRKEYHRRLGMILTIVSRNRGAPSESIITDITMMDKPDLQIWLSF